MANTDGDSTQDQQALLRAIQAEIAAHPATEARERITLLERSLSAGFVPNFEMLVYTLERPSNDENLAIELFQNQRTPTERERYELILTNSLLNYLAANGALIDHTRRAMRSAGISDEIKEEFEGRKNALISIESVAFIKDLRNFVLHRTLPFLGGTVTFGQGADGGGVSFSAVIELSKVELGQWDGWGAKARDFLSSQPEKVALLPIVQSHGTAMIDLHAWLLGALYEEAAPLIPELNDLITKHDAARFNITYEQAEEAIRDRTAREYGQEIEPDGTTAEASPSE